MMFLYLNLILMQDCLEAKDPNEVNADSTAGGAGRVPCLCRKAQQDRKKLLGNVSLWACRRGEVAASTPDSIVLPAEVNGKKSPNEANSALESN